MGISRDAAKNRRYWDERADDYQAEHGEGLARELVWGTCGWPEAELEVLGDVRGKDVLELGCGAAQWSIFLARRGARPVGLDNSRRQLAHARRLMVEHGVEFPLIHASAECVPLPDEGFDVVFCDHGAMSFADPARTVPEVARLLRPGGLLAFNMSSPFWDLCWNEARERVDRTLHADYFQFRRWEGNEHVEFQLPYGEWIRLFRRNGFVVEDLIELRAPEGARSSYRTGPELRWGRRWPMEHVWKVRRELGVRPEPAGT